MIRIVVVLALALGLPGCVAAIPLVEAGLSLAATIACAEQAKANASGQSAISAVVGKACVW